jgi:hypothetical protein
MPKFPVGPCPTAKDAEAMAVYLNGLGMHAAASDVRALTARVAKLEAALSQIALTAGMASEGSEGPDARAFGAIVRCVTEALS